MNKALLNSLLFSLILYSPCISAQLFNDNSVLAETIKNTPLARPVSLLDEVESAAQNNESEATEIDVIDPDVSYYVQNLNLTPEQISKVQKISADSVSEQESILKEITDIRRRARALEINSLSAFEAILDDSQKAAFNELRNSHETAVKMVQETNSNINTESF